MEDIFLWLLLSIWFLLCLLLMYLYYKDYLSFQQLLKEGEFKYTGDEYFDDIERFRDDFS